MVEILRQVARPELFFNLLDGFFHLGLRQKGKGGQHRAVLWSFAKALELFLYLIFESSDSLRLFIDYNL